MNEESYINNTVASINQNWAWVTRTETNASVLVSVDHPSATAPPNAEDTPPVFLSARPGDFVIVKAPAQVCLKPDESEWWMGQIVFCEGGARDARVNTMFQISDVDDGTIRWVNADEVSHIVKSSGG